MDERSNGTGPKAYLRALRREVIEGQNGLTHIVYFESAELHPHDLFAFGREALLSFVAKRYLSAIVMASALVERILNMDGRMRPGHPGRRYLTARELRTAQNRGLPVNQLLEQTDDLRRDDSVRFLVLRNQLAHGNLQGLVEFQGGGPTDYFETASIAALEHVMKTQRFEAEWYSTAPDVQEGRISHGRWPDP